MYESGFFYLENQVRLAQKGSQEAVRRRIPLKTPVFTARYESTGK
jgi:hypothetical protein